MMALSKEKLMWSVADQLHRSFGSISANLTEGYSRSKGLDRARFIEISLGSARESRDWYYKSRHVLPAEVIKHRVGLITHIIGMLPPMIPHQCNHAIREEQAEYFVSPQPSAFSLDSEVPLL
jgi:four helix bundle protein